MYIFKSISLTLSVFILFSINSIAQAPFNNYVAAWKEVESLSQKGLPKSALQKVKAIYGQAKKEKQPAQVIKSLVYMSILQQQTRENNEVLSVTEIESEIKISAEPATSILNSLLAGKYYAYYQQHRWQLYGRTQTTTFKKDDIATWGTEDFHKKISELYLSSVKNEKILQQAKIEPFNAIVIKGNMRHLRPTLYDLLVQQALLYFENDERDLKKPAYAFEISQASAFDPASEFVKYRFTTNDSFSLQYKALRLYQHLLAFHLQDEKYDALIDADLQRLAFVRKNSTHPEKHQLYFKAVDHIAHQYNHLPAAAEAWYLLAVYYNEQANDYKPYGDSTHRLDKLKAKEICEQVMAQKDSSEGKINCFNLLQQIKKSSFRYTLENVNVPEQPFRALISYRNLENLYLRIIPVDKKIKLLLEKRYEEGFWPELSATPSLKEWQQSLPPTNDMQEHKVEIKVDGLTAGEYLLLASDEKNFNSNNNLLGAARFYVSSISYVNLQNDYFVLNRDNGQPLAGADVQVWEKKYDYARSRYLENKAGKYTTDKNGYFKLKIPDKKDNGYYNASYLLEISTPTEKLLIDDGSNYYYYQDDQPPVSKDVTSVFLFTDRSIYRPGQTVYFKGIVLVSNQDRRTGAVKEGHTTNIYLRDANYRDVDSIKVISNEFGTVSGRFQLPQSGLTGQFNIYTKTGGGNVTIRVEEYKRPKFYVEYNPVSGTYKVGDTIRLQGTAKAYAGNNIDGALVKYRVVRQPRFIYPWLFYRWWQPPSDEMEITHGETQTDADGNFYINFQAIPDLKIEKKFEPVFDYTVYADVTDINGETRSAETTISVSYKSLQLIVRVPTTLPTDSLQKIIIETKNMNEEPVSSMISVSIYQLKQEKRLIRKRYWERPDQFVFTNKEYVSLFPYDEYDNESDINSWEKSTRVYEKTDSVPSGREWKIKGSFLPGIYLIEISATGKNGDRVNDLKFIELTDEKTGRFNQPRYLWTGKEKTTAEPGETAMVEWGSTAENLFVIQATSKGSSMISNETPAYSLVKLSNEKKIFKFPVTDNDRGGFGTSWMYIKNNRCYELSETINVPWSNKDLNIEYSTYREKVLPGSEEKWKVKITGNKKDKVAAEMLAAMYDASLDQFYPHSWQVPSVWPVNNYRMDWNTSKNFSIASSQQNYKPDELYKQLDKRYDYFIFQYEGQYYLEGKASGLAMRSGVPAPGNEQEKSEEVVVTAYGIVRKMTVSDSVALEDTEEDIGKQNQGNIPIRKNFNETAFFIPDLKTDSTGAIEFTFTMPEALTRWKFMALAHTKDASFGLSTKEIVTQKDVMVQPNPPRFLREGDQMEFSAKIVNLTDKEITGTVTLQLFDAATNEPMDGWFKNSVANQFFTVAAGRSEVALFPVEAPYQFNKALVWRIVAKAGNQSDGEENILPVLTNRMLVTESMPLPVKGNISKKFTFEKLLQSGKSETLQNQSLTIEFTSNPAWYAVQALPYLMEYPYECAEQTWNRYYANSLAAYIARSTPKLKEIFERWRTTDTAALLSNLQKNEELKSILLEETPWVLQAKTETEQKRNLALLFDMIKMSEQLNSAYAKLKEMQSPNGGFVWFKGGPDDRYITQYIITGIGHLNKLKAVSPGQEAYLRAILTKAIPYLDNKIKQDYDGLIKQKVNLNTFSPGYATIQYLYMRSFFPDYELLKGTQKAVEYFRGRIQKTWVSQSKYMQGMITLALYRSGDQKTVNAILKSLKETSISNEELGMYWKDQRMGWFWYEAPVETQSLLIETFSEAGKDTKTVEDLKTWLLKHKQTNNWKTTKATAEACYALLLQGNNWLLNTPSVTINLGPAFIKSTGDEEAGTGYFKKTMEGRLVKPDMANITVTVNGNNGQATIGWGAVYWQYFEDLDKISQAATPLLLRKKLFVETNTDKGPVLRPVNEGDILHVGDKIKVRIELRSDRDMEYVHLKDMRASCLEPVNVLSSYKWQDGLGYYESTRDVSTSFFFSFLRKGTYVFEYPLFVTHKGNFSNGISSIQCMYAPEFSAHSEGIRINIE